MITNDEKNNNKVVKMLCACWPNEKRTRGSEIAFNYNNPMQLYLH